MIFHLSSRINGSCPIFGFNYYLLSCFGLFALLLDDSGYPKFENLEKLELRALLPVLLEFTQITNGYYFIEISFIG